MRQELEKELDYWTVEYTDALKEVRELGGIYLESQEQEVLDKWKIAHDRCEAARNKRMELLDQLTRLNQC